MRVWREVRDDLCWKPGCSEGWLCALDENTGTMFDSFPCCVFSPIWARIVLEAVTFALKLSHKVVETRGLIFLKCIWRRTSCFLGLPGGEGSRHSVLAIGAVLRGSCSLSGITHIPSYSRPLHFEVGILKMPITTKGTMSNRDISPSAACVFMTKMKAGCPSVRTCVNARRIHRPFPLPQSLPYVLIKPPVPQGNPFAG